MDVNIELADDVKRAVDKCHWTARLRINVSNGGDYIILKGITSTFYQKQMAQEAAMAALRQRNSDVQIRNEIQVEFTNGYF